MIINLLARCDSTNDLAMASVFHGAPHGSCWVSDAQTSGRGRRDQGGQRRSWYSPPGKNLHLSVLLRPTIEPARAAALTLITAVAAVDVLRELSGLDIGIKWPNDLMLEDKKLAGILTEASTSARGLDAVVIGLGLNVNIESSDVPEDLRTIMTSLHIEAGHSFDRLTLAISLRDAIVAACDRFARTDLKAFLPDLRRLDRTTGRRVVMDKNGQSLHGTVRGIGDDGQLLVDLDTGQSIEVLAGEVRFEG
ncbi:MAG: biotin--[acetyl-CoA-carboxylase] ligase [Bradymonadaceae bacterium]